jgi:hypothetical protein
MKHINNKLMKLGGSLGNVPQKMKNLLQKLDIFRTVSPNCALENGLTVRNILSFFNFFHKFLQFLWNITYLVPSSALTNIPLRYPNN